MSCDFALRWTISHIRLPRCLPQNPPAAIRPAPPIPVLHQSPFGAYISGPPAPVQGSSQARRQHSINLMNQQQNTSVRSVGQTRSPATSSNRNNSQQTSPRQPRLSGNPRPFPTSSLTQPSVPAQSEDPGQPAPSSTTAVSVNQTTKFTFGILPYVASISILNSTFIVTHSTYFTALWL